MKIYVKTLHIVSIFLFIFNFFIMCSYIAVRVQEKGVIQFVPNKFNLSKVKLPNVLLFSYHVIFMLHLLLV